MAAASNIVIADYSAVNHTFVPSRKDGDVVTFLEKTTPQTALGFYSITTAQSASKSSVVTRSKIVLSVPLEVLDTVTGTYSYPYTGRMIVDFLVPIYATSAQRADLYAYGKNLLAHATIQSMIKDQDSPF